MSERLGLIQATLAELKIEPPFAAIFQQGFDEHTRECLAREFFRPELMAVSFRVEIVPYAGGAFLESLARLADPTMAAEEIDVAHLMACATSLDAEPERMARAVIGLTAVAVLEGIAFKRTNADFLFLDNNAIEVVVLPTVRWLAECGATWSAKRMAQLQREFLLSDPGQRASLEGRALVTQFRRIEARGENRLLDDCKEVAYLLRAALVDQRACVAMLFFAVGDAVRAFAIAGMDRHAPSLQALRDLVEVSIRLSSVDPLLRAVWDLVISTTNAPFPEHIKSMMRSAYEREDSIESILNQSLHSEIDIQLMLRQADEQQLLYKLTEAICYAEYGMTISEAYAAGLLAYFSTRCGDAPSPESNWMDVVTRASRQNLEWMEYQHSVYVRLFEILSLFQDPRSTLIDSDRLLKTVGYDRAPFTDVRTLASTAMMMDYWNARQFQFGRSIAYDNACYVEPWRREETPCESLQRLEWHRHSGMIYWLHAIPPACEPVREPKELAVVQEDFAITRGFREIAYFRRMSEMPAHCRMYGSETFEKLLEVDPVSLRAGHADLNRRLDANKARAKVDFPTYGERRYRQDASIGHLRGDLIVNGEGPVPNQPTSVVPASKRTTDN